MYVPSIPCLLLTLILCRTLNPIHVAAILTKLANISKKSPSQSLTQLQQAAAAGAKPASAYALKAMQARQALVVQLQQRLKMQNCHGHCPRGLANIVWALAKLQCNPDLDLIKMLLGNFCRQLAVAVPQDIANILWGVAQLTRDYGISAITITSVEGSSSNSSGGSAAGGAPAPAAGVTEPAAAGATAAGGTALAGGEAIRKPGDETEHALSENNNSPAAAAAGAADSQASTAADEGAAATNGAAAEAAAKAAEAAVAAEDGGQAGAKQEESSGSTAPAAGAIAAEDGGQAGAKKEESSGSAAPAAGASRSETSTSRVLAHHPPLLTVVQVKELLQQLCTMLPLAASQTISNIAWAVTVLHQCHNWCMCGCLPQVRQLAVAFSSNLHDALPGHVQRVVRCTTQLSTACSNHAGLAWVDWQPPVLLAMLQHLMARR